MGSCALPGNNMSYAHLLKLAFPDAAKPLKHGRFHVIILPRAHVWATTSPHSSPGHGIFRKDAR
jgi:hypothetical protein